MRNELDLRQSEIVDAIRFPLIVLVVFIHVLPFEYVEIRNDLSSQNIYHFISEMISHNLGRMAVPCFFFFSGYYTFCKMREWSLHFYFDLLKKKIKVLVVPYLLWNITMIVAIYIKNTTLAHWGWEYDDGFNLLQSHSIGDLLWNMPVNYPLWYLRDLICMTVLVPVFYYFFRMTKVYGVIILIVIDLLKFVPDFPGLSTAAFLYFGIGAFLGIEKLNILSISRKYGRFSIQGAVLLLLLSTYLNGTAVHGYFVRIFALVGVFALINIWDRFVYRNLRLMSMLKKLSVTVFFIYAVHEIYIINWLKGAFFNIPGLTGYFIIPLACTGICLGLFFCLREFSPRLLGFMLGGRLKKMEI